jgi:chain length determinant protein EpsF
MPLDELAAIFKARWRLVATTWAAVVAAVLAISLILPPRYVATAKVAVQMSGIDPVAGQPVYRPSDTVSSQVATQVDILRSEEVARGAVRSLGLQHDGQWRERWVDKTGGEGDFEAWMADELLRKTDVRTSRDSNVLTLSHASSDPQFAAAMANALVQSYMDATLRMQVEPARLFNAFFAERAKPLREALEQARLRLSAYEKEHGVVVGGEAPDAETSRLAELNSQLITLQDAAAEAANRRRQASALPGGMREVRDDPEVAALTGELVRHQGQLAELKSEFGDEHPAVVQARQSINDAKQRLDRAMRRAAASLETPSKVINARLSGVQAAVEQQRALVLKRKSERDAAAALIRDVENAQRAYDAVLARASQTALESDKTVQTSVSILKHATPPLWSPVVLVRNVLIAMALGLLLGLAWALLRERRDRRVRTIADICDRLGQPLLLALPDGQAPSRRRAEETRQRLVPMPLLPAPK